MQIRKNDPKVQALLKMRIRINYFNDKEIFPDGIAGKTLYEDSVIINWSKKFRSPFRDSFKIKDLGNFLWKLIGNLYFITIGIIVDSSVILVELFPNI